MLLGSALVTGISSACLAFYLKRFSPDIHKAVDSPSGTEWWPFWIFLLLAPAKWNRLSRKFKLLVVVAIVSFAVPLSLLSFFVIRFFATGANL